MTKKVERVDESGGVHSMWAPSASDRWLVCPRSVIESQALPKQEAGGAAKEGTIAHHWCEKMLLGEHDLDEIPDDTMRAAVELYTEYVEGIFEKYEDPGYEVEGRVALDQIVPGGSPSYWSCFGSADFFIYDEANKRMPEVIDFKYGRHLVDVEDNTQLMLYALGLVEDINYKGSVKLTIVQPRATHTDGPIRSWTVTWKELNELKLRARKTLMDAHKAIKVAGDHCHWCQLAPTCEVKNKQIQKLAGIEFAEQTFEPMIPDSMDDHQIALIIKHHKAITKWMESVVAMANVRARKGKPIADTKLVRNSGRRGWKDDKAFASMIKDLSIDESDAYKKVPEGIGAITKVLKEMYDNNPDELLMKYVSKSEGSISLVSIDDGRLEYNSAALDFADK